MKRVKEIDIKNCYYRFLTCSIQSLDHNKIKLDEKSYKNIFNYYSS